MTDGPEPRDPLSLEAMVMLLFRYFDLKDEVDPDSSLADLGLDSLQSYELLVVVEEWAAFDLPPELLTAKTTLRDLHHLYLSYQFGGA